MITVFGSLNVDMVMTVPALPQPGETLLCQDYAMVAGGKGANQAVAAARAGAEVRMVGCVGEDAFASLATASLRQAGVDVSDIRRVDRPTGCASVWVDEQGSNAIVVASGANLSARADQVADGWLGPEHWLVLQMEVPVDEVCQLTTRAKARGCRVLLNVAPAATVPADVLAALDVLVVNEVEAAGLATALGLGAASPPDLLTRELARRFQLFCVTTLGGEGAVAHDSEQGGCRVAAVPVTPVDTTAAGDTFVGYLAAHLAGGASQAEALRAASTAAALACTEAGAQPSIPRAAEVLKLLDRCPPTNP